MGAERITNAGDTAHSLRGPTGASSAPELASIIVDLAPDGILIVDSDGRVSFANPAAAAIFGYGRDEMVGLSVDVLVPECFRPVHARHRQDYAASPSPRPMGQGRDLLAWRADGAEVPVEVSLSPITVGGRSATIAVVRQVADRRSAERALRTRLLVEEDERIASELHDRVIKRLFLAGMKIQSVLTLTDSSVYQQLNETVDQLDTVIREIRHTVFAGVVGAGQDPASSTWS